MGKSRKGTYPVDVVLILPVELKDALDVGIHRIAEIELRLPYLVFFALSTNKILEDPGLDNRPAYPLAGLLGRSGPEATLGSSSDAAAGADFAEHGIRGDLSRALEPLRCRPLRRPLRQHHLLYHRRYGLLAPDLCRLRGGSLFFHLTGGLLRCGPAGPPSSTGVQPRGMLTLTNDHFQTST